jgi:hypothetical protein
LYFNNFPLQQELNYLHTIEISVNFGYNMIYLNAPIDIKMGYFIILTQATALVAIDSTGNSLFSDMFSANNVYMNLNINLNWRFYFNAIKKISSYQVTVNIKHSYSNSGLYKLTMNFSNSSFAYNQNIDINDSIFIT